METLIAEALAKIFIWILSRERKGEEGGECIVTCDGKIRIGKQVSLRTFLTSARRMTLSTMGRSRSVYEFTLQDGSQVVVCLFIGTQKRLVALHSALFGSRRDGLPVRD